MGCPGNNVIEIIPGFWRADSNSTEVIRCPVKKSCRGSLPSNQTNNADCNVDPACTCGYEGVVCSVCNDGYAKFGDECIACPSAWLNSLLLAFLAVVAVLIPYLFIHFTTKITGGKSSLVPTTVKILINYLQVLYYIWRLSADWAASSAVFFVIVGQVTLSPNFPPLQCALEWGFYDRLIVVYLLPVAITCVLAAVYTIRHVLFRVQSVKESWSNFQFALMLLLYQVHPMLMLEVISSLPCERVKGTGTSYLRTDMSVDCSSPQYKLFLAISIVYLVVYVAGAIVVLVYFLRTNAQNGRLFNEDSTANRKYAFFFKGYTMETYYWEGIVMLRKLAIVALSIFSNPALQLIWACIILTLCLLVHVWYKPFVSALLNRMDLMALVALYLTVVYGFHFSLLQSESSAVVLTLLVFLTNILLILYLVGMCLNTLRKFLFKLDHFLPKSASLEDDDMRRIDEEETSGAARRQRFDGDGGDVTYIRNANHAIEMNPLGDDAVDSGDGK